MSNVSVNLSYTDASGNLDSATQAAVQAIVDAALAQIGTGDAVRVTITPTSETLTEGQTAVLVATAFNSLNEVIADAVFTWSSDTPTNVTVDQSGNIAAFGAGGTANVTATAAGGAAATAAITVTADTTVATVIVSPADATVAVGGTTQLSGSAQNAEGRTLSGVLLTWSSSNTSDATVDSTGKVTGVAAGTVSIFATAPNGVSSNAAVASVTSTTGMSLTADTPTFAVAVGDTYTPTVRTRNVFNDTIGSPPTISWSSSNTGVATVNSSTGVVTGVATGAVDITASSTAGSVVIRGIVLSSTYTLRERWIKANSTSSAGTAETGQTWTAQGTSVAGILSDLLYFPTQATDAPVLADAGVSDGLFLFRMAHPSFGFACYLRWTDSSNYVKVFASANQITLHGKTGGSNLPLYIWNYIVAPTDVVIVRASGNKIQVQVNADIVGSLNDTTYGALTGTKLGYGFNNTTGAQYGRFGEIAVRSIDHTPSTTESAIAFAVSSLTISADQVFRIPFVQTLSTGENLSRGRTVSNSGPLVTAPVWSSDNTSVATVSSFGVISGVAPGSCTITATDGIGTATLSVSVGTAAGFSSSLAYTHEPSGFTQHTDRGFSQFNPAGSPDTWLASQEVATSHMTITTDSTAPKSPSSVLQIQYPAQTVAGGSTYTAATLELDMSTPHPASCYLARWTKLDPNFQGHPTSANKMGEFFLNQGASGMAHLLQGAHCKATTDPVYPALSLNGGTDYRESLYFDPNIVPGAVQIRGNWHKIEWCAQLNTIASDGTPNYDGEYHLWLDDLKVFERRDLKMADVTGAGITTWKPSWIWGGLGGTITTTFYLWEDHQHVSLGTAVGIP